MNKTKLFLVWNAGLLVTALSWITTNSSWAVTVEAADVTQITSANNVFLTSAFEMLKFIPTIAALAAGFYILNKIFGLIPKSWGWK